MEFEESSELEALAALGVDTRPPAIIRQSPEDFLVEEIPAYEPSERGTHAFVTFRKTSLTTPEAVRRIARAMNVDERGSGYAGMKDKHAITTQTASFPFPADGELDAAVSGVELEGIEVLRAARHDHKLKAGHLRGNRFTIVLRDVSEADLHTIGANLQIVGKHGIPNAFGAQRFGRDGSNHERALAWLRGESKPPRRRGEQRLLFSALQSRLFNQVLAARVKEQTWDTVMPGDLAKKHDTGGLFGVAEAGAELADAQARAAAGAISATGPMFGRKMREPIGQPAELEREILAAAVPVETFLTAPKRLGQGTRRALRLWVSELDWSQDAEGSYLTISFVLPKGGYATTVLSQVCHPTEAHAGPGPSGSEPRPGNEP